MELDKEPIDELLKDYRKPEDIIGENGLLMSEQPLDHLQPPKSTAG